MRLPIGIGTGLFLACLLGSAAKGFASGETGNSPFTPDFMRLQYAGNAGMFSAGPGYSWWHRKVEAGLSYGFVPEFVGDRNTHIISQKNSISPARLRMGDAGFVEPIMVGAATNFSVGRKYEVLLPEDQRDYYWPDGLYFWFFSGAKVGYLKPQENLFSGLAAQIEVGFLNQSLKAYTTNRSIGLDDILSVALSTQFYL